MLSPLGPALWAWGKINNLHYKWNQPQLTQKTYCHDLVVKLQQYNVNKQTKKELILFWAEQNNRSTHKTISRHPFYCPYFIYFLCYKLLYCRGEQRCLVVAGVTAVFLLNEVSLKQDVVPETSTRGLSKLQRSKRRWKSKLKFLIKKLTKKKKT